MKVIPKIIKKVNSNSEIKINEKNIYFDYSADVTISKDFKCLHVEPYMILCFDADGNDYEPSGSEMQYIVKRIDTDAEVVALEKTSSEDFISEEEQY